MNTSDPITESPLCIICGKDTSGGRGFMTLHAQGRLVAICCPLCYQVYRSGAGRDPVPDPNAKANGEPPRWL